MSSAATPFSIQVSAKGTTFQLDIQGTIGQDFSVPVANLAPFKVVQMDLKSVRFINSIGLKLFTKWLWDVEKSYPEMRIRLSNVAPTVNRQLLSVSAYMADNLIVDSLFVPMYCETCDLEDQTKSVTAVQVDLHGMPDPKLFQLNCSKCRHPLAFDGSSHGYFALLRDRKK